MCKNLENTMENQWSWNYCNEDWWDHEQFDTKEKAIADAKENYEVHDENINIGQCYRIPLPTYVDSGRVLEYLDEQYAEEASEWEDSLFEGVTNEQLQELEDEFEKVILKFYKKNKLKSPCWTVKNINTIHID